MKRRSRSSPVASATRPLFCVATTHVDEEDRDDARKLGQRLYDLLTRDRDDPLAFGPGIPVAIGVDRIWDQPDQIACLGDRVLLILVGGPSSILLRPDTVRDQLEAFQTKKANLHKLLVPTDSRWQIEAAQLKDVEVADAVMREGDTSDEIDAVLLAMSRCLNDLGSRPTLFVSYPSGADPALLCRGSPEVVGADSSPLRDYFATVKETSGEPPSVANSSEKGPDGILISVRSEGAVDRRLHDRDVIFAKQRGWPIVTVALSAAASRRESPYVGNVPVMDWNQDGDSLLRAAVVEHLRHSHFELVAERIIDSAGLPINTAILGRSPELLDLTSGPLSETSTRTVLHPDPAVTPENREILRAAAPLMHMLTPSTLLGRGRQGDGASRLVTPLDGVRIGLSVSDVPEAEFGLGQTKHHLQDVTVQMTRTLIGGGAGINYGGNFVVGHDTSFTLLMADLVQAYNQTATRAAERLRVFQSAELDLNDIPPGVMCRVRHLALSDDLARDAVFGEHEREDLPRGMLVSDMRRAMTAETDARIAVGGQSQPRAEGAPGYSGRFPGIAEEIFRAIDAGQAVYLCGGFGGITGRLVRLMEDPDKRDAFWDESTYSGNQRYVGLAWDVDHHPKRDEVGLPTGLREMADKISDVVRHLGNDDEAWKDWNGLTRRQNQTLWRATDPVLVSSLIAEGLIRWRGRRVNQEGKQRIEAIQGDVIAVSRADVLAVPVFLDVDPQGAGAAIDRVTGGAVRQGQSRPGRLIGVRSDQLDVDYLCAVSLGSVNERGDKQKAIREAIVNAAREMIELCRKEGFKSLAVVTFGGSTLRNYQTAIDAMLEGFGATKSDVLIKWVERSKEKFSTLVQRLREHPMVDVTTVLQRVNELPKISNPWFSLTVKWRDDQLDVTALPSEGTGLAWSQTVTLEKQALNELSEGSGQTGNVTPSIDELRRRGRQITKLIFGEHAEEFWEQASEVPIAITHNAAASKIPFEVMQFAVDDIQAGSPAVRGGMHRWLALSGSRISSLFGRPRLSQQLRAGLVIDPTDNLPGARKEGEQVRTKLNAMSGDVQLQCLTGSEATIRAVKDLLRQVDVLHFCGHAAFDLENPGRSGLLLAGNTTLSAENLRLIEPIPRVVIFNACEAARVRGQRIEEDHDSYSLAELMLRAGVEAFVGTFWEVDDQSAGDFAAFVYSGLTQDLTLRESVTKARRELAETGRKDWANYVLYGDGRFRLM